jgi:hypothetical protein
MSRRAAGRTQVCGRSDAQSRLRDAQAHLDLAELGTATSSPAEQKAAASSAVLAGIAAADAACCSALGQRSRTQDHRDAVAVLRDVTPGGPDAARQLQRLLDIKDASQYGFGDVGGQRLLAAQRQARALVAFAEATLRR